MRSPTAHDDAGTHEPSTPEPADRVWGAFTESAPTILLQLVILLTTW